MGVRASECEQRRLVRTRRQEQLSLHCAGKVKHPWLMSSGIGKFKEVSKGGREVSEKGGWTQAA